MSRDMIVKRLYVVNDGAEDIDMLLMSCLLHPFDYKLVRAMCSDREVDVIAAYHEDCIDELEFEVIKSRHKRTLDDVIDDIYRVDANERITMKDMIFIAETEDGEYIEFDIGKVREIMWQDFAEELEWEEEETEDIEEEWI